MKSPFHKIRQFALFNHGTKHPTPSPFPFVVEPLEITKGMQDLENMRAQYEGLLTNAQMMSGAAYDFSRSLQDMASYMVETFGQRSDADIGNIFSMLGKVQFELSKLLDLYSAHVSQAIISPTEMMIHKLQQVEVTKEQYDEKRQLYNLVQKEKRPKKGKGDHPDSRFAVAKEDFKRQADFLIFHLQSLKQERSQSLVTQAARFHTAQMHVFSKGLALINAVEPVVSNLALDRNIDRTLTERDAHIHAKLSEMEMDGSLPRADGEIESVDNSPTYVMEAQMNGAGTPEGADSMFKKQEGSSKSAPLCPSMYLQYEGLQNNKELRQKHKKISMYALPSPSGSSGRRTAYSRGLMSSQAHSSTEGFGLQCLPIKDDLISEEKDGCRLEAGVHPILKASCDVKRPLLSGEHRVDFSKKQYPFTSVEHNMPMLQDTNHQRQASVNAKFSDLTNSGSLPKVGKVYSHSGPLTTKTLADTESATVNNGSSIPAHTHQFPSMFNSGPVSRSPMHVNASPVISKNVSPPLLSPPRISELHKLPLPPQAVSVTASSTPLRKNVQETTFASGPASPLPPPPPHLVTQSLSIPESTNHPQILQEGKITYVAMAEEVVSSRQLRPVVLPVHTSKCEYAR